MRRPAKNSMLHARVTPEEKRQFIEKASKHGTPSEVLRELATAFVEGRLQIIAPSPTGKELLYVPRK